MGETEKRRKNKGVCTEFYVKKHIISIQTLDKPYRNML